MSVVLGVLAEGSLQSNTHTYVVQFSVVGRLSWKNRPVTQRVRCVSRLRKRREALNSFLPEPKFGLVD